MQAQDRVAALAQEVLALRSDNAALRQALLESQTKLHKFAQLVAGLAVAGIIIATLSAAFADGLMALALGFEFLLALLVNTPDTDKPVKELAYAETDPFL